MKSPYPTARILNYIWQAFKYSRSSKVQKKLWVLAWCLYLHTSWHFQHTIQNSSDHNWPSCSRSHFDLHFPSNTFSFRLYKCLLFKNIIWSFFIKKQKLYSRIVLIKQFCLFVAGLLRHWVWWSPSWQTSLVSARTGTSSYHTETLFSPGCSRWGHLRFISPKH